MFTFLFKDGSEDCLMEKQTAKNDDLEVEDCELMPIFPSSCICPNPITDSIRIKQSISFDGTHLPKEYQIGNDSAVHANARIYGSVVTMKGCVVGCDVLLRGDIAKIQLGRFVLLAPETMLRPPMVLMRHGVEPSPIVVGDYVSIGSGSIIEAAAIGTSVIIEKDCIVGARTVINDGVLLLAKSVVPADSTLTTFGVYSGNPAVLVGTLHPEVGLHLIRDVVIGAIKSLGVL